MAILARGAARRGRRPHSPQGAQLGRMVRGARAWRDSGKESGFQGHRDPAHRERPASQAGRNDLSAVWALNCGPDTLKPSRDARDGSGADRSCLDSFRVAWGGIENEADFKYNNRKITDAERAALAIKAAESKRLTMREPRSASA
jgi:hypothetical protein